MNSNDFNEKIFRLTHDKNNDSTGEVYIAFPNQHEGELPLLIALHGSGREALSYRDVPFYTKQRNLALKCGYIFACISNGSDTFGTDKGYDNIIKLYEYMKTNYKIQNKIALWASSAGGLMMHRFYRAFPNEIKLLLGTFPIYNPMTTKKLASLLDAYGAKSEEDLMNIVKEYSPNEFPLNIYEDTKIVIAHGSEDDTVLLSQSEELFNQVNDYGGDMDLIKTPGGHSVENFALYKTDLFEKALISLKEKNLRKNEKYYI